MPRITLLAIIGIAFIIGLLGLSIVLLAESKLGRPAIVYLKPGVVEGNVRGGDVTRTDKYVTVTSDAYGEEVFTWDQIRYISQKNVTPSIKLNQIVDLVDFLSKLGIGVTIALFVIGLYQYRQSQKWKREEFLVTAVKDIIGSRLARGAMQMLESLALYRDGRKIELFPQAAKSEDQKVFVSNAEIYDALTTKPHDDLDHDDDRAVIIRDCFDAFLSDLVTFYHYVKQDLITKDALEANIGYRIELLGPTGELSPDYKRRIFAYARNTA